MTAEFLRISWGIKQKKEGKKSGPNELTHAANITIRLLYWNVLEIVSLKHFLTNLTRPKDLA